jgi:hypothetical protein
MPTTQVVPNRSVVRAATVFFRRIIRRLGGLSYFGSLDDLVVTYFLNKKIGITTGYNLSLTYTLNSFFLKGGVPYHMQDQTILVLKQPWFRRSPV